jgi:phosphoribosylformimino-5-aminoimidazole carboxamide ribonucleotide (ProFAR) isomerase
LIASGGVASLADLQMIRSLQIPRIEGIIVGKALYAQAFTLEEALRTVEA